ncbi:hypothetical protein Acy02nite_34460 [Actinoplanes cyaneus]|uniref:FHA domain-containing protein n=1 Tax=Actinoplanes cyaneus TaxID=52696 RepID=A0A919IGE4_9ACTN|nr:FHA domain-containing protein [Actinoplanes cyaneus]MCW2140250.1 FHA domain-containing protein [Actinoplanes cyaneus]GID65565.1 hypothetical protein Acy02nite_34460 [Actinoplanes cyaneus]
MAQLICPGCKAEIQPGEQYCRSACFLTPISKPAEDPTTPELTPVPEPAPMVVTPAPAPAASPCGDPDCPHGGRAPAAGCRACGLRGAAAATTLRFTGFVIAVGPDRPLVVGRENSPLADRITGYPNVSRQHAEIRSDGTALTVVDLGSMNGTFVNDRRLPPREPTAVRAGDRVRFATRLEATVTGETS